MLMARQGQNDSLIRQKYVIVTSPWMYDTKDRLGLVVSGLLVIQPFSQNSEVCPGHLNSITKYS